MSTSRSRSKSSSDSGSIIIRPYHKAAEQSKEVNLNAPLPFLEGVGPSCQWLPAGPWRTVIDFFKHQYPHVDATTWIARMAKGQVLDEMGRRVDSETAFRVGACIFYYRDVENEKTIPFVEQVLYRDEHILVAARVSWCARLRTTRRSPANAASRPMGSWPGQSRFAAFSFTMITLSLSAVSCSVKSRPARRAMPMVLR